MTIPMEEKNSALKISRTGSNRWSALVAKSFGAVLISIPAMNAPTSAEFKTSSVIMVITTHRLTTPSKRRSCDFLCCKMARDSGHILRETITTRDMPKILPPRMRTIDWMEPEELMTGSTDSMTAKAISCMTNIPTWTCPEGVFISLVSIKPLMTIVVDDIARTLPKNAPDVGGRPANKYPRRDDMDITNRICMIPPMMATLQHRTRLVTENSTPNPNRRNVAPS
mmetsp:Transcript_39964/g.77768  ORF Transcript_39964/g.77768 Transcript_39964/m.77768 type:complete len:225 (-) Transcript_39964:654-1328(-)